MNQLGLTLAATFALVFIGCEGETHHVIQDDDSTQAGTHQPHGHVGPNGGFYAELGSDAHLEFKHDQEAGTIHVYMTAMDAKTPFQLQVAPILKLSSADGPLVKTFEPAVGSLPSAEFTIKDGALSESHHLKGRLTIEIGDSLYNPDLTIFDHSGHDH